MKTYISYVPKAIMLLIILLSSLTVLALIANPISVLSSMNHVTNVSTNATVTESNNFTTYNNSIFGVKIQYPSDWQNPEHSIGGIFIIQFVSPLEDSLDKFADNVNIAIQKLPINNDTTLHEYVNASDVLLSESIPGFNLIVSNDSANINGMPAVQRVFTARQAVLDENLNAIPVDVKMMQLHTLTDAKAYTITYTAEASKYETYLPIAQQMIDSFQIMNLTSTAAAATNNATQGTTNNATLISNTTIPTNATG